MEAIIAMKEEVDVAFETKIRDAGAKMKAVEAKLMRKKIKNEDAGGRKSWVAGKN